VIKWSQDKERQHRTGGKEMNGMTLGRVVNTIPGDQKVMVKGYLDGLIEHHTTASELCNRLDYARDTRESRVYGISVENNEIVIQIVIEH
jgi:hypothetical protein